MDMIRVLLVDDELLVRAGLRLLLEGNQGIEIVGEAADGLAGVQAVQALRPDVVLMDTRMPGMDGIEATRRICELPQHPAVLVLTAFDTEAFIADALAAGALGFLLKTTPPAELVRSIQQAAAGDMSFPSEVLPRIAAMASRASRPAKERERLASLSERELEVARAVARGLTNAEISAELHLSVASVKTYLNRIFDKTRTSGRVALALLVERAEG